MTRRAAGFQILVAAGLLSVSSWARAQSTTTGAVTGRIEDQSSKEGVAGATVVATSPVLQGTQAELTDSAGEYLIGNLPPGIYQITVYYGEGQTTRGNVLVQLGKTARVNVAIDTEASAGEVINIQGSAPLLDQGSTKSGVTITDEYTRNVPTGRTFAGTIGSAAGAQDDTYGLSFSGSTSPENIYIVEGVNTTDTVYGLQGTDLPNEFILETEVITGGYAAEYGRATGALVNVVTKSGGNDFHGSAFAYYSPEALAVKPREIPKEGSAIDTNTLSVYDLSVGGEIGGPIIKDKLWFHAGFNPVFSSTRIERSVSSLVDVGGDGEPDVDPATGFAIRHELERTSFTYPGREYFFTGKLSFAATPDHQGAISVLGNPGSERTLDTIDALDPGVNQLLALETGSYDSAAKWTSKFANNDSQIDAVVGWHHQRNVQDPVGAADSPFIRYDFSRPLSDFENVAGCADGGSDDPYQMIVNCPVEEYNVGGVSFTDSQIDDRISGQAAFTQRVRALGRHQIKVGTDFEYLTDDRLRALPGGHQYLFAGDGTVEVDEFYRPDAAGDTPCGADLDGDGIGDATCTFQPNGLQATTHTLNLSAFAQDSWSVLPNLSINAGLRWEQQGLKKADELVGAPSPSTGRAIDDQAFTLKNMFAPRLGVIYDWTKEGRSRAFAHYGRFYESMPMDMNNRGYGGEVYGITLLDQNVSCTNPDDARTCDQTLDPLVIALVGGTDEVAAPGMKAQYLDEIVVGVEYELIADLKVGATFINRRLGRVIEDLSTDGGSTYIIANPGEVDEAGIADVRRQADEARSIGDETYAAYLDYIADVFAAVPGFDKPSRTYNAIQLSATKRFSNSLMVMGSYTLSKTKGNFPGLFSPDTDQLDPNSTSQFDLPELMANRYGDLPQDRPHLLKIDGYYTIDLHTKGEVTLGASIRAASGIPHNVLGGGSVPGYDSGESFILPRGSGERSPFSSSFDTHISYGRAIGKGMVLDGFVDVFNVFNQQPEIKIDENYTLDRVDPIVGGDAEDLRHLKTIVPGVPAISNEAPVKNPNYGHETVAQAPLAVRLGLRLTF